jgi:hypothetical protein
MKRTIAVTVMCVAMMLMGARVRADDSQSRCTRIAHNWVKFWNQDKDISASDVFTEDIVYQDVPLGVVVDGAKAFQAFAQSVFTTFPPIHIYVSEEFLSWSAGVYRMALEGSGRSRVLWDRAPNRHTRCGDHCNPREQDLAQY